MKMYLNNGSVCELVYMLRDALMVNELSVALYMAREIEASLSDMILDKKPLGCELECPEGCKHKKETE